MLMHPEPSSETSRFPSFRVFIVLFPVRSPLSGSIRSGCLPVLCSHDDLAPAAGTAGLIERQRSRQPAERLDLRLQLGDLLLRGGNGIGAGDEAARLWLLARDGRERSRELRGVAGLLAILRLPELELLRSAFIVVRDGRLGVVRRLLSKVLRAEEPGVDDGGRDAERRDLDVQRLHPALEAELRCRVGADELEAGREAR